MSDIVNLLREGIGGLRSHAVIPDTANEPDWYRGQADLMQRAAEEIEHLREMAGKHDPTGADHMEEMWVHAERADAAEQAIQILAGFIRFDLLNDEDRALVERLTDPQRYAGGVNAEVSA